MKSNRSGGKLSLGNLHGANTASASGSNGTGVGKTRDKIIAGLQRDETDGTHPDLKSPITVSNEARNDGEEMVLDQVQITQHSQLKSDAENQ